MVLASTHNMQTLIKEFAQHQAQPADQSSHTQYSYHCFFQGCHGATVHTSTSSEVSNLTNKLHTTTQTVSSPSPAQLLTPTKQLQLPTADVHSVPDDCIPSPLHKPHHHSHTHSTYIHTMTIHHSSISPTPLLDFITFIMIIKVLQWNT